MCKQFDLNAIFCDKEMNRVLSTYENCPVH